MEEIIHSLNPTYQNASFLVKFLSKDVSENVKQDIADFAINVVDTVEPKGDHELRLKFTILHSLPSRTDEQIEWTREQLAYFSGFSSITC